MDGSIPTTDRLPFRLWGSFDYAAAWLREAANFGQDGNSTTACQREDISVRSKSSIVSRRRMTFTDLPSTSTSAGRSRVL